MQQHTVRATSAQALEDRCKEEAEREEEAAAEEEEEDVWCVEHVSLGPDAGRDTFALEQMQYGAWHRRCMTDDSTGLRVYGGAHCLARMLRRLLVLKPACDDEQEQEPPSAAAAAATTTTTEAGRPQRSWQVCELGAGTGAVGIALAKMLHGNDEKEDYGRVLVTDGAAEAVALARRNADRCGVRVQCEQLCWGAPHMRADLEGTFDLVVASDVMYYNVTLAELLETAFALLREHGVFIHASLVRVAEQPLELLSICKEKGWETFCVPVEAVVDECELAENPHFYNVTCLLTRRAGDEAAFQSLLLCGLPHRLYRAGEDSDQGSGPGDHADEDADEDDAEQPEITMSAEELLALMRS